MRKPLFRIAIAAAIVCVVLAPALIWSGQKPHSANQPAGKEPDVFKGLPFFTVGPPMTTEELAAREQEKLLSILEGEARAREYLSAARRLQNLSTDAPQKSIVFPETDNLPATEHPKLTAAELKKLAAIRNGTLKPREDRGMWGPKPDIMVSPIDAPLRPLGAEGLTPEERAKLETSRARERSASGDEGGRSR